MENIKTSTTTTTTITTTEYERKVLTVLWNQGVIRKRSYDK